MERISPIVLVVLLGFISWTAGQGPSSAHVPNRVINAKIDLPVNFTCGSHGVPLSLCTWERIKKTATDDTIIVTFNPKNAQPGRPVQPGYSYLGGGMDKGECGLVIQRLGEQDDGMWQCSLFDENTKLYRGDVNVAILRKPKAPQFAPALEPISETDLNNPAVLPKKITCYTTQGEPKPKFQWFIDDEPLVDGLGPFNETRTQDDNGNEQIFTFQELINHRFTYKDNGKKLRCVLVHEALTETDVKEVSAEIQITYPPRSAEDGAETKKVRVEADLGEEKIVSMNITANPRPTSVEWTVDNQVIREGQNTEKYDALILKEISSGIYEASLRVKNVAEEDLTKTVLLTVNNNEGKAEFSIGISSNSTGSDGINAGGILGIILAIIAILILIAVGVVYSRANGILCFKGDDGTASEKERMDGGSTGGVVGASEEKPASRRLSSRLSALYENLLAKKKDKTGAVDEEAGKPDKDTKEKETVGGEGVEAAPATQEKEKKPDDIVYAELDLARSGGEPRPEVVLRGMDDKTEYAEIVGVAPQAKTIDETSPSKKSPQGSPKK